MRKRGGRAARRGLPFYAHAPGRGAPRLSGSRGLPGCFDRPRRKTRAWRGGNPATQPPTAADGAGGKGPVSATARRGNGAFTPEHSGTVGGCEAGRRPGLARDLRRGRSVRPGSRARAGRSPARAVGSPKAGAGTASTSRGRRAPPCAGQGCAPAFGEPPAPRMFLPPAPPNTRVAGWEPRHAASHGSGRHWGERTGIRHGAEVFDLRFRMW